MDDTLKTRLMHALSTVEMDGRDIVSAGIVGGLHVSSAGHVVFALEVDPAMGAALEPMRLAAEAAAKSVEGVESVMAILTAERGPREEAPQQAEDTAPDPHGMNKNPPLTLPFRHVIAVASGKGGVGKSTTAFNIAAALAAMGHSVALLDADIYGPSIPRLTGMTGQKPSTNEEGKIIPLEAHGLKIMSMGFLVEEEKPMIWRGPMVQTAFYQMLRDVAWSNEGDMDFMIIDMPPGTGDVQLTLAQKVPVTGAVIVTTPQDLALIDARKAISMFEKTNVKILGIIENMSYYCCPSCGHRDEVFGHGGGQMEASKLNVPFLGFLPLSADIRHKSDEGQAATEYNYGKIAEDLVSTLQR